MIKLLHLDEAIHTYNIQGIIKIAVRPDGTWINWKDDTFVKREDITSLTTSHRYFCSCDPAIMDDDEKRYAAQILLELPENSPDRVRRLAQGLTSQACIDPCIVDAIKELWAQGIETLGCCCGHNVMRAWVAVHQKDYVRMFELGYMQRPVETPAPGVVHGLYTFFL